MPVFNDIDLNNWKSSEVWTDSLWIIPERDKTGKHSGNYHGNFVPQIPRQMILRYTKKNETVFDPFVGSGTTAFETEMLQRNFIGIDIQQNLVDEYLYKFQDEGRFGADPRLLVVYLDEDISIGRIQEIIENTDLEKPLEINFTYKHKNHGEKIYKVKCFVILLYKQNAELNN